MTRRSAALDRGETRSYTAGDLYRYWHNEGKISLARAGRLFLSLSGRTVGKSFQQVFDFLKGECFDPAANLRSLKRLLKLWAVARSERSPLTFSSGDLSLVVGEYSLVRPLELLGDPTAAGENPGGQWGGKAKVPSAASGSFWASPAG